MIVVMALAHAQPTPDLLTWVRPDYPDEFLLCKAQVRVSASGEVADVRVVPDRPRIEQRAAFEAGRAVGVAVLSESGQRRVREILTKAANQWLKSCVSDDLLGRVRTATAQWRFEESDAPFSLTLPIEHDPTRPFPIQRMDAPRWTTPEQSREGRACRARLTVRPPGNVTVRRVEGCASPAADTFREAIRGWSFTDPGQPWDGHVAAVNPLPFVPRKGGYSYVPRVASDLAPDTCTVHALVSERGKPRVLSVETCEPDYHTRWAARAVRRLRFGRSTAPWAVVVMTE